MDRRHLSVTRTGLLTRSLVTSEKGESTMTVKQFWRPFVIASLVASIGLLAAPVGPSVTWAASATATSEPPPLTVQTPTTLDSYLANVEDVLNVEAMKVHTSGVADVKLTIGKDGSVQQTEIERLEGPAALRDQITSMMSQVKFPPLPADAKADVLVVDATVAFNYPGTGMLDRFGRLSGSR
jgi:Gram-negative bacterial TonB protein C-terminal